MHRPLLTCSIRLALDRFTDIGGGPLRSKDELLALKSMADQYRMEVRAHGG